MKKRMSIVLSFVLVVTMLFSTTAFAASHDAEIKLYLDGKQIIYNDVDPEITNGRTMVPIRLLAERLGADVLWDGEKMQVTMTRADDTIVMTVGEQTATVNGTPMQMDIAPYITNGRTLIPARYLAEFFGQLVDWDGEKKFVLIDEDKSVAGDSNIEAWAIPMGAIQFDMQYNTELRYSQMRGADGIINEINLTKKLPAAEYARYLLSTWYGISDRETLVDSIYTMTIAGHAAEFAVTAVLVEGMTDAEYKQLLSQSSDTDVAMWEYTKKISEKWGDKGILCWDLFRLSNLAQWGYTAGYITYAESLAILEPAVVALKENFSSWDEAYENYIDGYHWWDRNPITVEDVFETTRGKRYKRLVEKYGSEVFNDKLFETDVISVPGLTAEQIITDVLGG